MPRLLTIVVLAIAVLALPATAAAKTVTKTFRYGPINVAGYEVKQTEVDFRRA